MCNKTKMWVGVHPTHFWGRLQQPPPHSQQNRNNHELLLTLSCHLWTLATFMTTTTTTTIYRPLIRDNPGRPVPEETFTHSHPSGSTCFLYHLSPFATVHGILFVQFTSLTVLSDNLSPGPLWLWLGVDGKMVRECTHQDTNASTHRQPEKIIPL